MENGCFRWWWMMAASEKFIHCIFVGFHFFIDWEFCLRCCGVQHFLPLSYAHKHTHTHTFSILYCLCDLFSHMCTRFFHFSIFSMRQCAQCTTYLKSYIHLCIQFFSVRQIKHPISHIICSFFPALGCCRRFYWANYYIYGVLNVSNHFSTLKCIILENR